MRTNTMENGDFLWANLTWHVMAFFIYFGILFRVVPGLDKMHSFLVLVATVVAGCVIGFWFTYPKYRDEGSAMINVVLSFGPYFVISYWDVAKTAILICGGIVLAVVAIYCALVFLSYSNAAASAYGIAATGRWIRSCMHRSRKIVAFSLAVMMFTAMGAVTTYSFMTETEEPAFIQTDSADWDEGTTISGNIDTVLLLQEEEWSKLDTDAKLAVMQVIADIEANYLGIPKLTVQAKELEDEDTLGHYVDATRTVTLNMDHLANSRASAVLSTLCHECYHAYQYRLIDLYRATEGTNRNLLVMRQASEYLKEFANYIDGNQDYDGYIEQSCEADSKEYAANAIMEYYYRINRYVEEEEGVLAE